MTSINSFFLYFAAILSICYSNYFGDSLSISIPQYLYELGDYLEFNAQLKNLPPGGNVDVFIKYEPDTCGKEISKEYRNKLYIAESVILRCERVLVELELRTEAGRCAKQKIMEGRNIETSEDWMEDRYSRPMYLSEPCPDNTFNFSISIKFSGRCNDDLQIQYEQFPSQPEYGSGEIYSTKIFHSCPITSNATGTSNASDTSNATGTSNASDTSNATGTSNASDTSNATATSNITGLDRNRGISTLTSIKNLVLLFGITFII